LFTGNRNLSELPERYQPGLLFFCVAAMSLLLLAGQADRAWAVNGDRTIFVNKYPPNASDTPGCEDPDFTEIGFAGNPDDPDFPGQGAVEAAKSGDIIFICGSPGADLDPYRPDPTVTTWDKDLTFLGDGPELTIIDGEGVRTPFYANAPGGYLNFASMTIRDGVDVNSGGALEAGGRTVNLDDVHFLRNRARGFGAGGGAIYAGQVNVFDSVFRNNVAESTDPAFNPHKGGAIYAEGSVSTGGNSEFRENEVDGIGGAIFANGTGEDPGLIEISDTVFIDNLTGTGSGGATFANGPTSVEGSVLRGNVAGGDSGGGGAGADGGAIWAREDVQVTESLFEDNSAPGLDRSGVGGAVASVGRINAEASDFAGNSAEQWGGALSAGAGIELVDSGFRENEATGDGAYGGAVYAENAPSTIEGSTFAGNEAKGEEAYGGAVRIFAAPLSVVNSTFTGNESFSDAAISVSDDLRLENVTSSANVGPFTIRSGGELSIGNSIIDEAAEACVAPVPDPDQPPTKVNLGGNVIADTPGTPDTSCDPFVGTGGGPAEKVDRSEIELRALTDNGGPTETMALGLTSLARTSAGVNLLGADPKDQRGLERPETEQSSGAYQLTTEQLTVTKAGAGSGTVTSSPVGINCGPVCESETSEFAQNPPFTTVTLAATAASGSTFTGWDGAGCSGTGTCAVTMSGARSVTATFAEITHQLSVTKSGTGSGTVTSSPAGIDCGSDCDESFAQGTEVTLTATPAPGSLFTGWSDACSGNAPTCQVGLDQAREVTAEFMVEPPPIPPLPPFPASPELKVSFSSPNKVTAGNRFSTRVTVANRAKSSNGSARVNGNSPTSATGLKSCLTLPKAMVPLRAKGAKVRGRKACWSKASLSAGEKVTYRVRVKVVRKAGSTATRKVRSATLRASVTASNLTGATFRASGKKTVRVTLAKPRRPKPITG